MSSNGNSKVAQRQKKEVVGSSQSNGLGRASPGKQLIETSPTRSSPGKQFGDISSVRASPGVSSETSSFYGSQPLSPASPSKARWANTRAAKNAIAAAPRTPQTSNKVNAEAPVPPKAGPAKQVNKEDPEKDRKLKRVTEEDSDQAEDEEGEEEAREEDEIVEPEDEVPPPQPYMPPAPALAPKPKPLVVSPPKAKPKPVSSVAKSPQPLVDLGTRSAGAAHYGRTASGRDAGPRRGGIWKDGSVLADYHKQRELEETNVEKKAHKGKKSVKDELVLDIPGILEPEDQDELLPWGTLASSPDQSEAESADRLSLSSGSRLVAQQRSHYHLLLTHNRGGGLAATVAEGSFRPKINKNDGGQELHVGDHIIALRGTNELEAIITDISSTGEITVEWEDGLKSIIKLPEIRDITIKLREILAGDRIQARRGDGTICKGLVKKVELQDAVVVVDWFDGKGVDCRVKSKDIVKVFDIDEDDDDDGDDGTLLLGGANGISESPRIPESELLEGSSAGEDTTRLGGPKKLDAVLKAEAARSRASIRIAKKVAEAIEIIPMNQDLTWSEFSRSCYDRFGRIHIHECHCGGNYCGVSGMCRRCGKKRGHHLPRGGVHSENICWTEDLYDLTSPLLDKSTKLNHSQQQYALRAVAQRLKTPPWDWKGPGTALKSAVDAECSELVYVMLQGGMDPDETDSRGVTPLHAASFLGRADICRLLLDGEAKVNVLDRHGQSPLFFAPTAPVCRLLHGFNADLNIINNNGQTALHFAARAGLRDVLQWFTERSSRSLVELKDTYGVTAAQYMVLSCPEIADEALTPGQHCFTNPAMRPGRFNGHHRLPEPRWEIARQISDDGNKDVEANGKKTSRAEEKMSSKSYSKRAVEDRSPL